MHAGCIGVIKRLLELTFNVGENRDRVTNRKLSDSSLVNMLMCAIQVPREFSRRIRNLDFGVIKAQEFRNIGIFYFNIVLNCIPEEFKKERKLWLQITFILRACLLTEEEFNEIPNHLINSTAHSFYKNYESVYGPKNCTYSIHLIASHLLQIRGDAPLTERSAFKYENFYSELRNLFQPGTTSCSKQILTNCYMKRQLENHNCKKSNFYDTEKKGKENNSLVYYIDENKNYNFFNIIEKIDENNFICNPQGKYRYQNELVKDIDWGKVGIFKVGPYSEEKIQIHRNEIHGKVLEVDKLFVTCPTHVLQEK